MTKETETQNEGRFLIGGGWYHNMPTLCCNVSPKEFRLDPAPLSTASLAVMNVLFAAFFLSILWLSYSGNPIGISLVVILVWVFTASVYSILMWFIHAKSRKLGPALIYDKNSGKLKIPRHDETFTKDDDIWLECLTARTEDETGDWNSELNLVFHRNGIIQRWNLMRSIATINPFNGMEREISRETGIRVVR